MLFSGPLPRENHLADQRPGLALGPRALLHDQPRLRRLQAEEADSHSGIWARLHTGQKRVGGGLGRVKT